jgi:DNA-binding MarR family transcriptional regulator
MPPGKLTKPKLAAEIWRVLFDFLIASSAQRQEALGRHGLTPNDSRALFSLDQTGRTMQSLAKEWVCDPSNATWVVDRLEERGLAERRSQPGDRRVRLVALTRSGFEVREQLRAEFYQPPPELLGLERSDLETLHLAVTRLSKAGRRETR